MKLYSKSISLYSAFQLIHGVCWTLQGLFELAANTYKKGSRSGTASQEEDETLEPAGPLKRSLSSVAGRTGSPWLQNAGFNPRDWFDTIFEVHDATPAKPEAAATASAAVAEKEPVVKKTVCSN